MIIFSPGPANISERVRWALAKPDICHRDSEFSKLLFDIRRDILKVYPGYKCVLIPGSGTLAIESVIASLQGYKIGFLTNGLYSDRACEIAYQYDIEVSNFYNDVLYVVHHETTTGKRNLIPQTDKILIIDAISSIGGEELPECDALIGSANKCIRGVTGLSFVVLSEKFINAMRLSIVYYGNLLRHLKSQDKGEPLFTPPVHSCFAFKEALSELLKEGVANRIKHYKKIAKLLRRGLKNLGYEFLIPETEMSNTMTVVYLKQNYEKFYQYCKDRGFIIYPSVIKNTFRLGTTGLITEEDIENFLRIL